MGVFDWRLRFADKFRGKFVLLFAVAALALASGCFVEERMFWSPDGSRAAVRLPQGLCLVDTNGTVSAPLLPDVTFAAWLPDGQSLVVLRQFTVTNWTELTGLVPRQETAVLEALAQGLPEMLKSALAAVGGDASALEDAFFKPLKLDAAPFAMAAVLCLRDTRPEVMREILAGIKGADQVEKSFSEASAIVHEISVLRLEGDQLAGDPLVLERSLIELAEPRPSPSAPVLAFLRGDVLTIAPLDGGPTRVEVADKVAGSYDWTPEGESLVFASGLSGKWEVGTVNLAQLQRRTVIGASGAFEAGESIMLGTAAFPFTPRVRCLPDGRVLFASVPLQLPNPAKAVADARFYLVDPARGADAVPVAVPSEPGALPADLAAFAVSPDGRQIAIAESGSDAVAVLEMATGRLEIVSPNRGGQGRTLPAWRGSEELYFAALPEAGAKRPEWMRRRQGAMPQIFSGRWQGAAVRNLMEMPKE